MIWQLETFGDLIIYHRNSQLLKSRKVSTYERVVTKCTPQLWPQSLCPLTQVLNLLCEVVLLCSWLSAVTNLGIEVNIHQLLIQRMKEPKWLLVLQRKALSAFFAASQRKLGAGGLEIGKYPKCLKMQSTLPDAEGKWLSMYKYEGIF